ncbi:uncharacterized protein ACB058_009160 isoform 2-T2 [Synchiropus picturatus]
MPKSGKPDSFWAGVMSLYAQGKYRFSTGQRPGSRRWRAVNERIQSCPLTPQFGETVRKTDIFGRKIPCVCGYHESGESTVANPPAAQGTSTGAEHAPKASAASVSQGSSDSMTCSACGQAVARDRHAAKPPADISDIVTPSPSVSSSTAPAQELTQAPGSHPQDVKAYQSAADLTPVVVSTDAPEMAPAVQSGPPPHSVPAPPQAAPPLLYSPDVSRARFLPKCFLTVIKPGDREWIAHILYEPTGRLKQDIQENWHHPPNPTRSSTPNPHDYFRQRMFLWAPMRMCGIPLKCTRCDRKMHRSGIYPKVREVIDVATRYYLIGADYPRCSNCEIPVCPWSEDILKQLDPATRNRFPAVLSAHMALDRTCVTLLRPRKAGNSSSYLQQAFEEAHSEEWVRRCCEYFTDCERHKTSRLNPSEDVYPPPPPFCPLPPAQWFEGVSRWNNRTAQGLWMTEPSRTKIYDVCLVSDVNALSDRVLGRPLLPEFIPPGKHTGERIAVEYLPAHSNRGDLQTQQDMSKIQPATLDAVLDEESTDSTVSYVTDVTFQEFIFGSGGPSHTFEETANSSWSVQTVLEESDTAATSVLSPSEESEPLTPALDTRCDSPGFPEWEAVTEEPLPEPRALPSQPVQHGQAPLEFHEPENREGEARIRQRRSTRTPAPLPQSAGFPPAPTGQWPPVHYQSWSPLPQTVLVQPHGWICSDQPPPTGPQAWPFAPPPHPQGWWTYPQVPPPHFYAWPSTSQAPTQGWSSTSQPPSTSSQQQSSAPCPTHPNALDPTNRHRQRRLQKAALEDQERERRGEPPRKRHSKEHYHYQCKHCGKAKTKSTGHSQVRGKWYCPASGQTFEEWRDSL